ncbi:MAG TPA: Uma2 family endonuclease [Tepidisphaeraceae bacterium]|jgi:Uma2 family endonuclease
MTLVQSPPANPESRVVLENVSWAFYERMLTEIGNGPTRLTFDNGRLEIMSPSRLHERVKNILGRIVEAYGEAMDIVVEAGGSMTFRREDLQKGLEPDECYYVAHAADILQKDEIDLSVDPPPDLVIEVDISRPLVERQPIYAAMGVPEVWTCVGAQVVPLHLVGGEYQSARQSLAFANLPMGVVNQIVLLAVTESQSAAMKSFRNWLQSHRKPT